MLHELEQILQQLKKIEQQLPRAVFEENEIQEEMREIDDFPELIDYIHQKLSILQEIDCQEIPKILKTVIDLHATLCSCSTNIELVQEKVIKLRGFYAKRKAKKT